MHVCIPFKALSSRLQDLCRIRKKTPQRKLEISAPFNFKHENATLPGISDDEISILKEKALASRIANVPHQRRPPPVPSTGRPLRPMAKPNTEKDMNFL